MMLATEPMIVRLPARVVVRAITFHISSGCAKLLIHLPATSTKGTLENTLDPSSENQAKFHAWLAVELPNTPCTWRYVWSGNPVLFSPSTTMNKAAKNTSRFQSTSLSTGCVSRLATKTDPQILKLLL